MTGPRSSQRPAWMASAGLCAVVEQPGRDLQQDLRLPVAAHRAEHRRRASRRCRSPAPATACAAAGGRGRARPGGRRSSEKPRPRLCRLICVFGSTSHEPNPEAFDWISDTPMRSASTVHRYVVSPSNVGVPTATPSWC